MSEESQAPSLVEARRRKAYMIAREIGLDRDMRIELAQVLLRRDVTSWKQLDEIQVLRLLDAMEGYEKIHHLKTIGVTL